jgi:hypothetical protein
MARNPLVMSSEAQRSRDISHCSAGRRRGNNKRFLDFVSLRSTPLGMTASARLLGHTMARNPLVMSSEAQRSGDISHCSAGRGRGNNKRFLDFVSLRFTPLGMTASARLLGHTMARNPLVMSSEAQRSRDLSHCSAGRRRGNNKRFLDFVSLRFTPLGMTASARLLGHTMARNPLVMSSEAQRSGDISHCSAGRRRGNNKRSLDFVSLRSTPLEMTGTATCQRRAKFNAS